MSLDLAGKKVVVTGASGALGAHVILRLLEIGARPQSLDLRLDQPLDGAVDAVIHLAGVNRSSEPKTIGIANEQLSLELTQRLDELKTRPAILIFSNSTQVLTNDSPYSEGKRAASAILQRWCNANDVEYVDVLLPNLIGEFGKPFHNMVSTTVIENLISKTAEVALNDSELRLLELQDAAEAICTGRSGIVEPQIATSPIRLLEAAERLLDSLKSGVFPDLTDRLNERLYGMLVEAAFRLKVNLHSPSPKTDERGTFTEIGRIAGGHWQVSTVSVAPGATRGNHFHRRLIENFTVLSGTVKVDYGRAWLPNDLGSSVLLSDGQTVTFPVGWWHSFTNVGSTDAQISIVSNRWFDLSAPDTVPYRGALA